MTETIDRRNFLRLAGAAALAGCSAADSGPDGRPNIVIVMADDMGFSDIGPYGGEIDTPTLDYLAANGLRFTQFYNTARCCPTRAALLTGIYQHQAGVGHMVGDMGRPAYRGYLNDRCVTIAEALKPASYTTLMSGKWHVGEERPHWPVDRGFDEYFGLISGASNYFKLDGARTMALGNEPWTPPDDGSFYMTDAIADHAVEFLDKHGGKDNPFLLYLPFTAPHWPPARQARGHCEVQGQIRHGLGRAARAALRPRARVGTDRRKMGAQPPRPGRAGVGRRGQQAALGAPHGSVRRDDRLHGSRHRPRRGQDPQPRQARQHPDPVSGRQRRLPRKRRYRTGHAAQYLGRPERHAGRAGFVRRLRPAVGQRRQHALPHVQKLGA